MDFWMPKPPEILGDSETASNNSSRNEPKRPHQWFMNGSETESLPNKRQAVEIPNPNSYTALLNSNIYCGNPSNFHSITSQFTERPFENETPTTTNFGIDSTFGLSISHPLVGPGSGISYGGIKKVKVSEVKDDVDFTSVSMGNDESVTTGVSFDNSFISMSDSFRDNNNNNGCSISVNPSASKDNNINMDAFSVLSNVLSVDNVFNKTDNNCLSMRSSFGKGENNIISFGGLNHDANNINSSGRLVCNYDFLMGQPSVQRLEENSLSESTNDAFINGVQVTTPGDIISKKKEQKTSKKNPPNNFPSNVRSLLSTGMLDGVHVKYVAWSQEKELRGVIKGAAYLCGCQSCTFSKAINAYEFERHAGCKTKHPNNHIYFDNGKTIYGVVQELRNTPQNVLFEVIQTITGSPINQKSFRIWKDSFLAATRELQRIYGKEEGKVIS